MRYHIRHNAEATGWGALQGVAFDQKTRGATDHEHRGMKPEKGLFTACLLSKVFTVADDGTP